MGMMELIAGTAASCSILAHLLAAAPVQCHRCVTTTQVLIRAMYICICIHAAHLITAHFVCMRWKPCTLDCSSCFQCKHERPCQDTCLHRSALLLLLVNAHCMGVGVVTPFHSCSQEVYHHKSHCISLTPGMPLSMHKRLLQSLAQFQSSSALSRLVASQKQEREMCIQAASQEPLSPEERPEAGL